MALFCRHGELYLEVFVTALYSKYPFKTLSPPPFSSTEEPIHRMVSIWPPSSPVSVRVA